MSSFLAQERQCCIALERAYNMAAICCSVCCYSSTLTPSLISPSSSLHCLELQEKRKEAFSRRRSEHSAADIDYINDRNKHFNKKIKRAYDKYTVEIRQNLERGTAL